MALPQLTDEQRAAALEKAAAARRSRAELKERLKRGGTTLKQVLVDAETDEALAKLKVSALLEALPGVGKVRAAALMEQFEIAPSRRVRGPRRASAAGAAQRVRLLTPARRLATTGPTAQRRPGAPVRAVRPVRGGQEHGAEPGSGADTGPVVLGLGDHPGAAARRGRRGQLPLRQPGEQFAELIAAGRLLEHAQFAGNRYGTPRDPVEERLAAGEDVLLEIEVQGARQVRAAPGLGPEAVLIFLAPPSFDELDRRLVGRGTEDAATIDGPAGRGAGRTGRRAGVRPHGGEHGRPDAAAAGLVQLMAGSRPGSPVR